MPLHTFSDPGFVSHAAEAAGAANAVQRQQQEMEISRYEAESRRMQAEAQLQRASMADQASRQRAARNLGIAIEKLDELGLDPAQVNIADDYTFVAQHQPDLAESIRGAYTDESQLPELRLTLAQARQGIERGLSAGKKRNSFESFLRTNQQFLTQEGGSGPGGKATAENPLLEQLRTMAQDPQVDVASFELAKQRVSGQLQKQTAELLTREQDLADAQALWSQYAGTIKTRMDRERAVELMARVTHGDDPSDRRRALFELGITLTGQMEQMQEMLDENSRNAAASVMAMMQAQDPQPQQARPRQGTTVGGGAAGATGLQRNEPLAGGAAKPMEPKAAAAELSRWVEETRTARGLIHEPTLLAKAEELLGRPVTKDEVREILRGTHKPRPTAPPKKPLEPGDSLDTLSIGFSGID